MQIKDEGVFGHLGVFKNLNTHRPWGYYGLYSDNEVCTTKILYVKPGQALSMQFHRKRDQLYYLIDPFTVQYSLKPVPRKIRDNREAVKKFAIENVVTMKGDPGDMFGFERGVIHRLMYVGDRKSGRCLDLAFGENDEEDITRIMDFYNRES